MGKSKAQGAGKKGKRAGLTGVKDDILLKEEQFDLVTRDFMYRMLIENMSEGAVVVNPQNVIVYGNRHFAHLAGVSLEKVIGADFTTFLADDDRENFFDCIATAGSRRSYCELTILNRTRGRIPVLASIVSFVMEDQDYLGILATDISYQKRKTALLEVEVEEHTLELAVANRRLTEINRELRDMNNYLDNFVHAIAHDMRAPVANLRLIEEMLQEAPEKEKPTLIASMYDNIHRLDATLKGLVQIIQHQSAREQGKTGLDPSGIIREVIREEEALISRKNAEIHLENRTGRKINYVEGYLKSIARNMISNALKYNIPGVNPRLEIIIEEKEGDLLLVFRDNGCGIDLDRHGRNLFKPFQRFSSDESGIGIGLHIVHTMVERNGGHIEVESQPGKGSTFTCFLKEYHV